MVSRLAAQIDGLKTPQIVHIGNCGNECLLLLLYLKHLHYELGRPLQTNPAQFPLLQNGVDQTADLSHSKGMQLDFRSNLSHVEFRFGLEFAKSLYIYACVGNSNIKINSLMRYLISNAFSSIPAPTDVLVVIVAITTGWVLLHRSKFAPSLMATVSCVLIAGALMPVGEWLARPLENKFPQWQMGPHAAPDGIIAIGGESGERITALAELSLRFPQARLVYSGSGENSSEFNELLKIFARHGGDPQRITLETRSRNTYENAAYSSELIKPNPEQRWILVTFSLHMPRAVGSFRRAGFRIEAYPVKLGTGNRPPVFAVVKEWMALVAYRVIGRTDALFPTP